MFGYKYVSDRPQGAADFPGPGSLGQHFYRITDISSEPKSSRYLCVCKLHSIWQLIRSSDSAKACGTYLLDLVFREIGEDLKNGRCFVLLDQSGEGHPFVRSSFDDLHSWCDTVGLNRRSIGYLTQNRSMSREYNAYYGSECGGVRILNYDWIINDISGMLESPENEFFPRFRFSKAAPLDFDTASFSHPFLCLNATPRPIRVSTLAALMASGILPRTLWSLLTQSAGKGSGREAEIQGFLKDLGREDDLLPHAITLLRGPEKKLDNVNITNANQLMWSIDYESYKQTCVSLVTETEFTGGQIIRVTEKSVKAFAMARVVMIFGNPNSLALMRSFGFQTFDPMIDEAYDQITVASARFAALCDEVVRVDDILRRDPTGFIEKVREICNFNAVHARTGGFRRSYKSNVEIPFWRALQDELGRDPLSCRN